MEENANLVVRLLIRRPECLGPALRGEGGGLLKAMKDGVKMSEQIAAARDGASCMFLSAMNDEDDTGGKYLFQRYVTSYICGMHMRFRYLSFIFKKPFLTLYTIIMPFDAFEIQHNFKILWKVKLLWSKCSIFHKIYKSNQNFA